MSNPYTAADPADSTEFLTAIRDARLAVLRTAKLLDDPTLFSVRSLFRALAADAEIMNREAA